MDPEKKLALTTYKVYKSLTIRIWKQRKCRNFHIKLHIWVLKVEKNFKLRERIF